MYDNLLAFTGTASVVHWLCPLAGVHILECVGTWFTRVEPLTDLEGEFLYLSFNLTI